MKEMFEELSIPEYDLEAFMKSITYQPKGMSVSLARRQIMQENPQMAAPLREAIML